MPDVSLAALPWLAGLGDIMSTVAARARRESEVAWEGVGAVVHALVCEQLQIAGI